MQFQRKFESGNLYQVTIKNLLNSSTAFIGYEEKVHACIHDHGSTHVKSLRNQKRSNTRDSSVSIKCAGQIGFTWNNCTRIPQHVTGTTGCQGQKSGELQQLHCSVVNYSNGKLFAYVCVYPRILAASTIRGWRLLLCGDTDTLRAGSTQRSGQFCTTVTRYNAFLVNQLRTYNIDTRTVCSNTCKGLCDIDQYIGVYTSQFQIEIKPTVQLINCKTTPLIEDSVIEKNPMTVQ